MSLMSMNQWSMTGISSLTFSSGTLREVSAFIFQAGPHRLRKARMKSGRSSGSPPPKVTPPPVARKYSSSFLVSSYSSAGVISLCGESGDKVWGLRQYRQRSRQPMKATRVFTPSPSTTILCLAIAAISAFICLKNASSSQTLHLRLHFFPLLPLTLNLRSRVAGVSAPKGVNPQPPVECCGHFRQKRR